MTKPTGLRPCNTCDGEGWTMTSRDGQTGEELTIECARCEGTGIEPEQGIATIGVVWGRRCFSMAAVIVSPRYPYGHLADRDTVVWCYDPIILEFSKRRLSEFVISVNRRFSPDEIRVSIERPPRWRILRYRCAVELVELRDYCENWQLVAPIKMRGRCTPQMMVEVFGWSHPTDQLQRNAVIFAFYCAGFPVRMRSLLRKDQ